MNSTADIIGWAPEPRGRGTIGLLWSCFATIFLCTWNAIHPHLPGLNESKFKIVRRRIAYVLLCLIAPELFAMDASIKLAEAIHVKEKAEAKITSWSLKQSFFLLMGGFVVLNGSSTNDKPHRVRPKKLLELFQEEELPWPTLSDAEINDRSKADWVVKSLAILQSLWFTAQLIGRWAQGLAVTTLELFTFGIVICAIITYIANWEKPFDVRVPVVLTTKHSILREDWIDRLGLTDSLAIKMPSLHKIGLVAICLGFGAIHVGGWNFHFPSMTEQLLWRISSVACVSLPLTILSIAFYGAYGGHLPEIIQRINLFGCGPLYVLFRIYMFIEMFITLRAVPASVYQTPQWSQYFPSFD